jgi:hypothetical protein
MASPAPSLLQSVVWPAVAGNVAWAALSVAVGQRSGAQYPFYWERLCLLGVMAVYLILDWTRTESKKDRLPRFYWIADALLAASIALLAIAAQGPVGDGWFFVLPVYTAAAVGHLFGAWQTEPLPRFCEQRLAWTFVYLVAGMAVGATHSEIQSWTWSEVATTTAIIVLWTIARFTTWPWLSVLAESERVPALHGNRCCDVS